MQIKRKLKDTLENTSAICSLRATDRIMRIAIIPTKAAATINAFFIVFSISALLFAHNEFVSSNAQAQISRLKILIFNL